VCFGYLGKEKYLLYGDIITCIADDGGKIDAINDAIYRTPMVGGLMQSMMHSTERHAEI
jgi:hypothetical protein